MSIQTLSRPNPHAAVVDVSNEAEGAPALRDPMDRSIRAHQLGKIVPSVTLFASLTERSSEGQPPNGSTEDQRQTYKAGCVGRPPFPSGAPIDLNLADTPNARIHRVVEQSANVLSVFRRKKRGQ